MGTVLGIVVKKPGNLNTNYLNSKTADVFFEWKDAKAKSSRELIAVFEGKLDKAGNSPAIYDYTLNDLPCPIIDAGKMDRFLYTVSLQAIRLAALFHDVGHPPFSHILEEVLRGLYREIKADSKIKGKWDPQRTAVLLESLNPYFSEKKNVRYTPKMILSHNSLQNDQLHEKIGVSFLEAAISDVIPQVLEEIHGQKKLNKNAKSINALYYIMVAEVAMAIFTDSGEVFRSFHTIIDGTVDADRLDYVMRDMRSCGVDWGQIPYGRIINNIRFNQLGDDRKGPFVISFPEKVKDDITDFLVTRYKIFLRINFHHRVFRTAAALQASVGGVARAYLKAGAKDGVAKFDEISVLWESLAKMYPIVWTR